MIKSMGKVIRLMDKVAISIGITNSLALAMAASVRVIPIASLPI